MQVYLERNANGKTPFKIQVKKQAPKPKQKSRPRSADRSRGFQVRHIPWLFVGVSVVVLLQLLP